MKVKTLTGKEDKSGDTWKVTIPALWNYNKLVAFLNKTECVIYFGNTPFFECRNARQGLLATVVDMESFMEAGFTKRFERSLKRFERAREKKTGGNHEEQRWLIVERPVNNKSTINIERFYQLVTGFEKRGVGGFKLKITTGRGESVILLQKLVDNQWA